MNFRPELAAKVMAGEHLPLYRKGVFVGYAIVDPDVGVYAGRLHWREQVEIVWRVEFRLATAKGARV